MGVEPIASERLRTTPPIPIPYSLDDRFPGGGFLVRRGRVFEIEHHDIGVAGQRLVDHVAIGTGTERIERVRISPLESISEA